MEIQELFGVRKDDPKTMERQEAFRVHNDDPKTVERQEAFRVHNDDPKTMERQEAFRVHNDNPAASTCTDNDSDEEKESKRTRSVNGVSKKVRSTEIFKLIKTEEWNELVDFLHNNKIAANEWVTEHNPDGSVRWRSLPIHLACEKKPPVDVIYHLLSIYPGAIGEKNYGGDLPLHIACREGASKEVINFMLVREKNTYNSSNEKDCEGRLALHLAASKSGTDVQVIKDLAEVNAKAARTPDDFGLLPLHWACSKNASKAVVEALLDVYPYANETKDSYGRTPIALVKLSENKEKDAIIELLSQDVSYYTTNLINTIDTLSTKVIKNGQKDNLRKKTNAENQ